MITSNVKTITPEYANQLLLKNTSNRPINKATVESYTSQIISGMWKLNGEPIIISDEDTLLDGQHRLNACVKANKPIQAVIVTGVPKDVFATIDTGRVRTTGDIFNIQGIQNANQVGAIIAKYYNFKKGAVRSIDNSSLTAIGVSKQQILDFYNDNQDTVVFALKLASQCYQKVRLLSMSSVGAYFLYLVMDRNHPIDKVSSFFYELFGISNSTNTTVTVCRDMLLRNLTRQRVLTPTIKTAYVIKAWNAYLAGKDMKQLSYDKNRDAKIDFN